MIIDDEIFEGPLRKLIQVALISLENSKAYYNLVNDQKVSDFIYEHDAGSAHFNFLKEVLRDQELAKCPKCGHYNAAEMVNNFRLYQASLLLKANLKKDED